VTSTAIIVTAGVAELAAGAIAMGLGGFLAARSDAEHYASEQQREQAEVQEKPDAESREIVELLGAYGLTEEESAPVVAALRRRPEAWVEFMMRFELGLEKPEPGRALASALTIGGAYVVGGLIPLAPYMLLRSAVAALAVSSVVTLAALTGFGYAKGCFTGTHRPVRSAIQTALIGAVAATAAFAIARIIA
jgi:VIT1/CCC1 family predicted Fe2+/Mn2+ transporter